MKRFGKAICLGLIGSLSFGFLLWWNLSGKGVQTGLGSPYNDPMFAAADILFFVCHILSLIRIFLLFVEDMDNVSAFVKAGLILGALSIICSLRLIWKGEWVSIRLKEVSSFALSAHPDLPAPVFYAFLVVIWLGILYAAVSYLKEE